MSRKKAELTLCLLLILSFSTLGEGAGCSQFERTCKDGSCVDDYFGRCPGECKSYEYTCENGKCVSFSHMCPENCALYERKCSDGSKCVRSEDKCDGSCDCTDCADESNCRKSFDISSKWWIILVVLVSIPILVCIYIARRHSRRSNIRNVDYSSPATALSSNRQAGNVIYSGTSMQPVNTRIETHQTTVIRPPSPYNPQPAADVGFSGFGPMPSAAAGFGPMPSAPSTLAAAAARDAPPSYQDIASSGNYKPPEDAHLPPPPTYDSATQPGAEVYYRSDTRPTAPPP